MVYSTNCLIAQATPSASLPDEPPRAAPEYEACKRLAESSGLPLAEVYRIVQAEGEARLQDNPN